MAMLVNVKEFGVDVAKDWLDIFDGAEVIRIENRQQAIRAFLKTLPGTCAIAIESTNTYHELMVELAVTAKHTVYLIDAYRLSRYRDTVGVRAKTDVNDARLLHRYMRSEKQQLKTAMGLSLTGVAELAQTRKALLKRFEDAMAVIDKRLLECIKLAEYQDDYRRCLSIPGIGPLNATALVALFHRGYFSKSDAFIAFMGLDVRVRESGYFKGKRKLTKKGSPEMRRLLFNAARAGAKTKQWNAYYLAMRARGHSTTATAVAISRKIARLAFALMRDQSEYRPI